MAISVRIHPNNSHYGSKYVKRLRSECENLILNNDYILHINSNVDLPSVTKFKRLVSVLDKENHWDIIRLDTKSNGGLYRPLDDFEYTTKNYSFFTPNKTGIWLLKKGVCFKNNLNGFILKHRIFCNPYRVKGYPFSYFLITVLIAVVLILAIHYCRTRKRHMQ